MRGLRVRTLALVITALLTGSVVHADTIAVTGGGLDISGPASGLQHSGTLEISGDRAFTLTAFVSSADGVYGPIVCADGCRPGDPLSIRGVWLGTSLQDATVTLDGITYTNVTSTSSLTGAGVEFTGMTRLPSTFAPSAVLSAPFTFTGSFFDGTTPYSLFGRGTATIFLETFELPQEFGTSWGVSRVQYAFSSDPGAPIPEPSTLLLIGGGLGTLILRARRRARPESRRQAAEG